ncbi:hypothetical protein EZS27_014290 [termite gut metagenome]|uniref:Uncharacterized protein n=1 Tax=termite gut metagenome TaxID=433724 RepID=A0A5J4RWS5_9ZZZZ
MDNSVEYIESEQVLETIYPEIMERKFIQNRKIMCNFTAQKCKKIICIIKKNSSNEKTQF